MNEIETSIMDDIYQWSTKRPEWQRDALRRIIQHGGINENDIEELYCLLVKDPSSGEITPSPLEAEHLALVDAQSKSPTALLSISDVQGVNKLANDQILSFLPNGITIIYGDNGTGKSGYTRILKNSCRARHRELNILPNVDSDDPEPRQSAHIQYSHNAGENLSFDWQFLDKPNESLSSISIFDGLCSTVHLREKNEIAYKPYGLDIPDKLASLCIELDRRLQEAIEQLNNQRNAIFHSLPWGDNTTIGKLVSQLSSHSDIEKFKRLAVVTVQDKSRLELLNNILAQDPTKTIQQLHNKADAIRRLIDFFNNEYQKINDASVEHLFSLKAIFVELRTQADCMAKIKLSSSLLPGVTESLWKQMWQSAKRYSNDIVYQDRQFPDLSEQSQCVLCQQKLDNEAISRLKSFEKIMQDTSETEANNAQSTYEQQREKVLNNASHILHKDILETIKLDDLILYKKIKRFLATIRLRRCLIQKKLSGEFTIHELPSLTESVISELENFESTVRESAEEYARVTDPQEKKNILLERNELLAKQALNKHLTCIEDEIIRLKAINQLNLYKRETTTTGITQLGNRLADKNITITFGKSFENEISTLVDDRLNVKVERTGGSYGAPQYKVQLKNASEYDVSHILSEGEQTCVGLACFLAELSTANDNSGLVFDDPINSLDHKWRSRVAERLVNEAKKRQVIIFTHDLVFLNDILDISDNIIPVSAVSLHSYKASVGHVCDSLPWGGMGIKEKIDHLDKEARRLKRQYETGGLSDQEYKDKARTFFSKMREAWEKAYEQVVLAGSLVRFRNYINPNRIKKVTVFSEDENAILQEEYEYCCRFLEGHDSAAASQQELPKPEALIERVNKLGGWVEGLKEKQRDLN